MMIAYTSLLSLIYVPRAFADENDIDCSIEEDYIIKHDESGNERVLDEDGKQVAYYRENETDTVSVKLPSKMIQNNNKNFAEKLIDVENYTLDNFSYNKETDTYTSTYYKYCDGYKTQDFCFIDTDSNGNIISFAAMNQGSFDNIDLKNVKQNKIDKHIDNLYQHDSNIKDYGVVDIIATLDEENKIVFCVSVEITYIDKEKTVEQICINNEDI